MIKLWGTRREYADGKDQPATSEKRTGLLADLWNEVTGKGAHERAMELAQWQYDKDIEFWNMQNAYNTPESQMDRYRAAGVNPNLVANQTSAGNASGSVRAQAPDTYHPVPNIMNAVTTAMGVKNTIARLGKMAAEIGLLKTRNAKEIAQLPYVGALEKQKLMTAELRTGQLQSMEPYFSDMALANLHNVQARNQSLYGDIALKDQLHDFRGKSFGKQLTALDQQIAMNESRKVFEENKAYFARLGVMNYNNPIVMAMTMALKASGVLTGTTDLKGKSMTDYFGGFFQDAWSGKMWQYDN